MEVHKTRTTCLGYLHVTSTVVFVNRSAGGFLRRSLWAFTVFRVSVFAMCSRAADWSAYHTPSPTWLNCEKGDSMQPLPIRTMCQGTSTGQSPLATQHAFTTTLQTSSTSVHDTPLYTRSSCILLWLEPKSSSIRQFARREVAISTSNLQS